MPTLLLLGLLLWVGVFALYAPAMPKSDDLAAAAKVPAVTVLAADGSVLADAAMGARFVPLGAVSPLLVKAVVATEDRRFWNHFGVDVRGVLRATVANLRAGEVVEGGSTITQQLAKVLFLTPERSLKRKLEELTLAIWLEARLTKDEILTLYLNKVYLGAGTVGVEAAARRYFAKPARELGLAESAMIAGLLKAPSAYAPTRDLARARDRAAIVLENMVAAGVATEAEATAARAKPAKLAGEIQGDLAGHFVDWAMEGLADALGRPTRDLVVRTTLDPKLQRHARDRLRALLAAKGPAARVEEGAVVMLGTDGAVLAMVGGESYRGSRLNRATDSRRQPGSAFKPFLYLAAVERGWQPGSTLLDAPVRIGSWSPENHDGRFRGEVTLEEAFAQSLNAPAARLAQKVGVGAVVEAAHRLGVASAVRDVPSVALGTSEVTLLELTAAYQPLAAGGVRRPVHAILEVQDARTGRVLFRHRPTAARIVEAGAAATMRRLMERAVAEGTGRGARVPGRAVAGKTGTTQRGRDAWFVGWSGGHVLGVWLGNDDNRPTKGVTGGGLPATLWRSIMEGAPPTPVEEPAVAGAGAAPTPAGRTPTRPSGAGGRNIPEELATRGLAWLRDLVDGAPATERR